MKRSADNVAGPVTPWRSAAVSKEIRCARISVVNVRLEVSDAVVVWLRACRDGADSIARNRMVQTAMDSHVQLVLEVQVLTVARLVREI